MSDSPDVLAAARRLAARLDAHAAEGQAIRVEVADLVALAEAAIPKTPDGVPIPDVMLDAARKAVGQMLGAGLAPSKTAVIQQLRLWRFSIGKDMERPIWEHVAPMVDVQADVVAETEDQVGTVASLPGSSVLLDGEEWREAG